MSKNPIDEYLDFRKEAMEKDALNFGGLLSGVAKGLTSGAGNLLRSQVEGTTPTARHVLERGFGIGQRMQESAFTGGAAAAGGLAITGLGVAAQKIMGAITKRRDFNDMMGLNPDLKDYHNRSPEFFNATYSSLRRINPSYGSDPIIAGAQMRKMMESPDTAGLTMASTVSTPKIPQSVF